MNPIERSLQTACVLLTIMISVGLHATDVTEKEILIASRKWIVNNAIFQKELPNAVPDKALQMTDADGRPIPLWQVNLLPTGYLVMSSDDTLPPVVAFNTNGPFKMPASHPLPSMLVRQGKIFQDERNKPQTRGNEQATENQSRWNTLLGRTRAESIIPSDIVQEPMLTTQWSQSTPYNYFCPSGNSYSERAITGCVALSLAQILKYHEWPMAGNMMKTHTDNEGDVQGTVQADYSIPYNWNKMEDSYIANGEQHYGTSELATARLTLEMTVLVEADYDIFFTSAFSHTTHTLLAQYLGYSNSMAYGDSRNGYIGYIDQSTLYARIRKDMMEGRPAIVAHAEHSFVADGLSTMDRQDYYHFNYGWGGSYDGWYLLTDGYEETVIICATTNIQPSPVATFKPMSREQSSSFTLTWDFPKRLTAEAFRLTKTTGTRASTVISSSISGMDRSYTLTDQSGTATYKLEAKVGGTWQAMSDGVTVTVKTNPSPMLSITVNDDLKSISGVPAVANITANNTLTNLTVTSSRPDILPNDHIIISGSGATRSVQLTPANNIFGNVLLYLSAIDSIGNTVRQTVPFRVMPDEPLKWYTTKDEAMDAAKQEGKLVLLVAGRDDCYYTNTFRNSICEISDIKGELLANYTLWYCNYEVSSEYSPYVWGLGNTFPWIAIIAPDDQNERLRGHGGPIYADETRKLLNKSLPYFNLDDSKTYDFGNMQQVELSVLTTDAVIHYRLDSQTPDISDELYSTAINLINTTTISARAFKDGVPLEETVTKTYNFTTPSEFPEALAIVTGTDVSMLSTSTTPWTLQTTTYNTSPSAMQSGEISHNESTVLLAKVNGSGSLSFHWKVSSEYVYDKLIFSIDGVQQDQISGEKDWEQKSYRVLGSGDHYFSWIYSKDYIDSYYDDCAWVDDIVWTEEFPVLKSIEIVGQESITTDGVESYTCTATFSDGTTKNVTPIWDLSSTQYAAVDETGKVFNQNMTKYDQTVTITAAYTQKDITKTASFNITLKGYTVQLLELYPGWNLITLTKQLKHETVNLQAFLALKPMAFDNPSKTFILCDNADAVKVGIGYWIFSKMKQSIELVQDSSQSFPQQSLKSGWNLVGMLEDSAWPSSDMEIWGWRNGRFRSVPQQDLQVGHAYWVFLY